MSTDDLKKCGKCGQTKSVELFGLDKGAYDGRRYECKECRSKHEKSLYEKSKDKHVARVSKYKNKNRDSVRASGRRYYREHKKEAIAYRKANKEHKNAVDKEYRKNNKPYYAEYMRRYNKSRRDADVSYKLIGNLRHRVWLALRGHSKSKRTKELVGCTIERLIAHLESKFSSGMSWSNYGKWHVDHVIPCTHFDMTKESEQLRCFNWENLQPMWARDNIVKSNRITT